MVFSPTAKLIIVEGNIGVGKTTLAKSLGKLFDYKIFLEPTISNPYLEHFYQNPKKYALKMQLWLLRQRFQTYVTALRQIAQTGRGIVLDRSVYSDWVFAEQNRRDGNISEEGYQYYLGLREKMLRHLPLPHAMVYLDVSPQECHRRIHQMRCRDCESGIPIEYLSGLRSCYDVFVQDMERTQTRVLRLNWNEFGQTLDVMQQLQMVMKQAAPWHLTCHVEALLTDDMMTFENMIIDTDTMQVTLELDSFTFAQFEQFQADMEECFQVHDQHEETEEIVKLPVTKHHQRKEIDGNDNMFQNKLQETSVFSRKIMAISMDRLMDGKSKQNSGGSLNEIGPSLV